LSPLANVRNDKWGGSLEKRASLLLEVVRAVRSQVGPEFPVSVKLNTADFQRGDFAHVDVIQVAKWLSEEKIDLLELSSGNYDSFTDMRIPKSTREREAYSAKYCKDIRAVVDIPIMLTGGFRTRAAMEKALQGNEVDMIGLGRPLCCAPDGPKKLLEGIIDSLPCYERDIQVGPRWMQWFFGEHTKWRIGWVVRIVAQQAWYFVNEYRMADGLEPLPPNKLGCLAAMRKNRKEECLIARSLQGIQSHGTEYNQKKRKSRRWAIMISLFLFLFLKFGKRSEKFSESQKKL